MPLIVIKFSKSAGVNPTAHQAYVKLQHGPFTAHAAEDKEIDNLLTVCERLETVLNQVELNILKLWYQYQLNLIIFWNMNNQSLTPSVKERTEYSLGKTK